MLTFEKRELHRAAQHVSIDQLSLGTDYYMISYIDNEMKIPLIDSMIFIGTNVFGDENNETLYFQDAESYLQGIRIDKQPDGTSGVVYSFGPDELTAIFEFERALEQFMKCSLKRNKG
jgi:hypothetical protein